MQMQVKYGLLARIPTCEKERFSLRAQELPLPSRDLGTELKHGCELLWSWIGEFHGMSFWNHQGMPFAEWTDGQESNAQGVLGDAGCEYTPGNDLTEDACTGSCFFLKGRHFRTTLRDFLARVNCGTHNVRDLQRRTAVRRGLPPAAVVAGAVPDGRPV